MTRKMIAAVLVTALAWAVSLEVRSAGFVEVLRLVLRRLFEGQ